MGDNKRAFLAPEALDVTQSALLVDLARAGRLATRQALLSEHCDGRNHPRGAYRCGIFFLDPAEILGIAVVFTLLAQREWANWPC